MRAVIINASGVVVDVVDLAGKTIDPDGRAARGPASYRIERPPIDNGPDEEEAPPPVEVVEYEAVITAPEGAIFVASADAGIGWSHTGGVFSPPAPDLEQIRAARIAEVNARAATILSAGAPVAGGLHVALDDSSRADLTAMATTALAALSGALTWPESYALGWIAIENIRIPLATPVDGLSLANAAGHFCAQTVQNRRDLKDALLAADDFAALDEVDIEAGWPA